MNNDNDQNSGIDWAWLIFWLFVGALFWGSIAFGIEIVWRLIHG